jgi:hypothetical protein
MLVLEKLLVRKCWWIAGVHYSAPAKPCLLNTSAAMLMHPKKHDTKSGDTLREGAPQELQLVQLATSNSF